MPSTSHMCLNLVNCRSIYPHTEMKNQDAPDMQGGRGQSVLQDQRRLWDSDLVCVGSIHTWPSSIFTW